LIKKKMSTTPTMEERVMLTRVETMHKFGEAMKLLLNTCEFILKNENEQLIAINCCPEYEYLQNFRQDYEGNSGNSANPIEHFYQVIRHFIDTYRHQLFAIVGNDMWLLDDNLVICFADGYVDREEDESDSFIPLGYIYGIANRLSVEELRKTKQNMDIVKMPACIRLALLTLCESVAYEQDKMKLQIITKTVHGQIFAKSSGGDNPIAPFVNVFRTIFTGIIPDAENIPVPTMSSFESLMEGTASAFIEHGSLVKESLVGFHQTLKEEEGNDISAILMNFANKAKNPEVKGKMEEVTNAIKNKFGTLLPTEEEEKAFFSKFLSIFDRAPAKEDAKKTSSSSSSSDEGKK